MGLDFLKRFSREPEVQRMRPRRARLTGLCIDGSGSIGECADGDSVSKAERIAEGLLLAKSVFEQNQHFRAQGQIATVIFNNNVEVQPFADVANWVVPRIRPGGETQLGKGLHALLDTVENYLVELNAAGVEFHKPYAVLISDGKPTGEPQRYLDDAIERARQAEATGAIEFISVGVDESDRGHLANLRFRNPPTIISETSWAEVFLCVSQSVSTGVIGQRPISIRQASVQE